MWQIVLATWLRKTMLRKDPSFLFFGSGILGQIFIHARKHLVKIVGQQIRRKYFISIFEAAQIIEYDNKLSHDNKSLSSVGDMRFGSLPILIILVWRSQNVNISLLISRCCFLTK